ncbi:MAG: T9SS type A sorting domain-containing protein [Ignavibacteriales bacterium]|nr:T9SS type A sorting domain-containing protein [Ignavibacteriales bacterium]
MKKRFSFSAVLFFLICNLTFAQSDMRLPKVAEENNSDGKGYRVDAHQFLEKFNKANGIEIEKISQSAPALQKSAAWNFVVGSQKSWYASDFVTSAFYSVPSTCRAVGTHCYIFVEDALWETKVNQVAVDSVREAFDNRTPANPNKGIYQTDVDVFGNPPNVDNDNKIIILILDIIDGYEPGGGFVAGYYYGYNQFQQTNSNFAEIYYLDGNPLDLLTEDGLQEGMSTTAHEFQHMIHFNYIPSEETFFDESWSLAAEVINGYPLFSPSRYANEPNYYLLNWRDVSDDDVLNDYSRAARFSLYLYEQFGTGFFTKYMSNKIKSINGVDYALQTMTPSTTRRFKDILADWFIANKLNDKSVDAKWGYNYSGLPAMKTTEHINPNVSETTLGVYKYGVQYLTFKSGSNLVFNLNNNSNTSIKVKAIKKGTAQTVVEDVTVNNDYAVTDFGTAYSDVTFAVYISDPNLFLQTPATQQLNFTYSASGNFESQVIELAYDTTEPNAVYVLSVGDTVAVRFDGVQGAKLDSIRVALRNTAQIEGGIWKAGTTSLYTGKKQAGFFVSGLLTPAYDQSAQHYPIPYPNWVKVDLRSSDIDASGNFIAAFIINGVYENSSSPYNRVMHTNITGTSPYHSYTYLNNPSGGDEPGWYYLGDGTNISLYLIRAYVSLGGTDVDDIVELIPSSFSLEQNYPNPFNPSTIISYSIPTPTNVQIKIYDVLGREIRSLINEEKAAGKYNLAWDSRDNYGRKVSSGVYFYTITAGNFAQTRKMVLTK